MKKMNAMPVRVGVSWKSMREGNTVCCVGCRGEQQKLPRPTDDQLRSPSQCAGKTSPSRQPSGHSRALGYFFVIRNFLL